MANRRRSNGVALITGGASGIGRAFGELMAERGYEVVLADRQVDLANEVAGSIRASGGRATAVELDVTDYARWRVVRDEVLERSGSIDFLFNNAGIAVGGEIGDYAVEDWDDVIDVNLRGVTNGIQACYPGMIERRSGHIVNVASVAGLLAIPGQGSYTATKHAVVGLSKALRIEAARHGVRVSVVCPGAVRTPILKGGAFGRMKSGLTSEVLDRYWESVRPMAVDEFARRVIPRVLRNEPIIVEPSWWRLIWGIERLSPELFRRIMARSYARTVHLMERARRSVSHGPNRK